MKGERGVGHDGGEGGRGGGWGGGVWGEVCGGFVGGGGEVGSAGVLRRQTQGEGEPEAQQRHCAVPT